MAFYGLQIAKLSRRRTADTIEGFYDNARDAESVSTVGGFYYNGIRTNPREQMTGKDATVSKGATAAKRMRTGPQLQNFLQAFDISTSEVALRGSSYIPADSSAL
jgi:hypothetical protein